MSENRWRRIVSSIREKTGAESLLVYRNISGKKLVRYFQFPSNETFPFALNSEDGVVREILGGTKVFFGESHRFGEAFSSFSHPFLAVFPLKFQRKTMGILVAGSAGRIQQARLDSVSDMLEQPACWLAVEELEEEKKEMTSRIHILQKKLAAAYHRILDSDKLASLGRFAGGLAHELNTPLGAIRTYAEYLQLFVKGETEQEALEGILKAVSHSREIVENVLRLSREQRRPFALLQMKDVIHDALLLTSPELEKRKISVEEKIDPGLQPVMGDRTKLVQVVTNLLVNARDAICRQRLVPRQGKITVSLSSDSNANSIFISDNGPGIPDSVMGKIFDPFFTTKDVGQGTGLGLSICQAIVEEHRGKLEVISEVGRGTDVLVKIPVASEEGLEPRDARGCASPGYPGWESARGTAPSRHDRTSFEEGLEPRTAPSRHDRMSFEEGTHA